MDASQSTIHKLQRSKSKALELRNREKLLSGIIKNTPGMVFQFIYHADSGQYYFTYVSEGSMQLFGLMPAEIMADSIQLEKKFHKADRKTFVESMRASLKNMTLWNWEGQALRCKGMKTWINCRATPRHDDLGNTIWEGVMLNISSSKQSELELLHSRQELRNLIAHIDLVRENDKKTLAREMHDELGQALTVMRLKLALLRMNFGADNALLVEQIRLMKMDLDQTSKVMRQVTSSLRPVALDQGLTAGLEWLIQELRSHTDIAVYLHDALPETETLDDIHATALFRIVQESLTNIIKHADASEVRVVVMLKNNQVHLSVEDNGAGFILDSGFKPNTFGLIGIQERALMLRGCASIDSVPGRGTVISVTIPFVCTTQQMHHAS